ncbi:Protein BIG GRAIN 1-like B [Linum perenne]
MYKLEEKPRQQQRFCQDSNNNNSNNPSFSSTLLDEIYRSIDVGNTKSPGHLKFYRDKKHTTEKPPSAMLTMKSRRCNAGAEPKEKTPVSVVQQKSHQFVEFERKFLLLQQQRNKHDPDFDQDPLFFSSSSNSSDSSSGGFSSSDTDSIYASRSRCSSLPPPTIPKPIKTTTTGSARSQKQGSKTESRGRATPLFYEDGVDVAIKSKSRALRIYSKVKQPISPGGKLANFINSLFTAGTPKKKSKDHPHSPSSKSGQASSCSSASSFSRSCLSKNSPSTREKLRNGEKRTVRFYPVSVIVDEDSRPCGHKRIYKEQAVQSTRTPLSVSLPAAWKLGKLPPNVGGGEDSDMKQRVMEKSRRVEEAAREFLKDYRRIEMMNHANFDEEAEEGIDDDDDVSCSSSDLFELDHLGVIGRDDMLSEELPVFETTRVLRSTNRVIGNRFL